MEVGGWCQEGRDLLSASLLGHLADWQESEASHQEVNIVAAV